MAHEINRLTMAIALALVSVGAFCADDWHAGPESKVGFTADQAGVPVNGQFDKFTADIHFNAKNLTASHFDVRIDLASVMTDDEDRDVNLKGPEMFWAGRYPEAQYVTAGIASLGGGKYQAQGKLTLRGVTMDVPITFTFLQTGSKATLEGGGQIMRLAFGVGKGQWASTDSISDPVKVEFKLNLTAGS